MSSVAKIGYIPKFKASNARDQDEVSSDLARMGFSSFFFLSLYLETFEDQFKFTRCIPLSIYLSILPYALTDILGRCAVEQKKAEN